MAGDLRNGDEAEIDAVLRSKRKAREHKSCWPCRRRKVKCNNEIPCKTCIDREHPELCSYHPPEKRTKTDEHHSPESATQAGSIATNEHNTNSDGFSSHKSDMERLCAKLDVAEQALSSLRAEVANMACQQRAREQENGIIPISNSAQTGANDTLKRHNSDGGAQPLTAGVSLVTRQGIHAKNPVGGIVHLGGSSVPALVMALGGGPEGKACVRDILGKSILPIFGLDNESATYPFVDLWSLSRGSLSRFQELATTLPNDIDCWNFLEHYKRVTHVVFPGVIDIAQFEQELQQFLTNRRTYENSADAKLAAQDAPGMVAPAAINVGDQTIYGKSVHYIGLLFAALASGVQCSQLPRRERELTSQIYVCCSFECLRLTNFFSHPSLDNIQTLLVLGNVISNNMNAGVAWALLGLTIRLSQTLGLHRECKRSPADLRKLKLTIWRMTMWQDSILSIIYDRATCLNMTSSNFPPLDPAPASGRPYDQCMYRLCEVGQSIIRERATVRDPQADFKRIMAQRTELRDIMNEAAPFLRDFSKCNSEKEQLEHWALYLHVSYMTSELCRPAISPSPALHEVMAPLRQTCIDSLTNTVEAFLGLADITPFAHRSWAGVHRALSSALLLGILGEPAKSERVRHLLGRLLGLMTMITSKIDPAEQSTPLSRAIVALRKLNIHDPAEENTPTGSSIDDSVAVSLPPMQHLSHLPAYARQQAQGNLSSVASLYMDPPMLNSPAHTLVTPSPLARLDDEQSPYTLMDSIIWGDAGAPFDGQSLF